MGKPTQLNTRGLKTKQILFSSCTNTMGYHGRPILTKKIRETFMTRFINNLYLFGFDSITKSNNFSIFGFSTNFDLWLWAKTP